MFKPYFQLISLCKPGRGVLCRRRWARTRSLSNEACTCTTRGKGRTLNPARYAVQAALGADKVAFEQGVYLDNYGADWQMENAAKACEGADAAVIFLGLSSIKDHRIPKPDFLQVDESWARPAA